MPDHKVQELIAKNEDCLEKINDCSKSSFVVDAATNPHPRYSGIIKSIIERRKGAKF